jgi:hypothetical protein
MLDSDLARSDLASDSTRSRFVRCDCVSAFALPLSYGFGLPSNYARRIEPKSGTFLNGFNALGRGFITIPCHDPCQSIANLLISLEKYADFHFPLQFHRLALALARIVPSTVQGYRQGAGYAMPAMVEAQ